MLDYPGLLRELVVQRTVSGDPKPQRLVMEIISSVVRSAVGAASHVGELDGTHPWVLLTNDAAPSQKRILFACHVDTVPAGELANWDFDPFAASVEDGILQGRGTSDMKAGLVAATVAVIDAAEYGIPVALLLTSDEEIGSLGAHAARHAVAEYAIGATVVPEATGNVVHLGHRGALWLEIATKGVAAHGSTPEKGESAIMKLVDLLSRSRTELPLAADSFLGAETFNVGTIGGGSAPNIVADMARVIVDHRTVGSGEDLLDWWRSQREVDRVEARINLPSVRTSGDDAWVLSLNNTVANVPVTYFTDASILAASMPTVPIVVWGPGSPELMHAVNESVSLREVDAAVDAYIAAARAWTID